MEERESSVASSADFYGSDAILTHVNDVQHHASHGKRKAEDTQPVPDKKRKFDTPSSCRSIDLKSCARLPPEVWQHVFLFCSLADLGRLIQVNRYFLSYLTDVRSVSLSKPGSNALRLLKSESLWASARNALSTKPPKPLPGLTELHMWQLAWSKRCQFCNKLDSYVPGEKIWQKGPGDTGVRTIWPFGIRTCGPCLKQRCQTDSSLLFSAASALRPALPFTLLTNDNNYITAYMLQSATAPADVEIGKFFYTEHVEEITQELNDALSLGSAAAEEWSKGLDARGKERMRLAENWERWEVKQQGGHRDSKHAPSVAPSVAMTLHREPLESPIHRTPSPLIHAPSPASKYVSAVSIVVGENGASRYLNNSPRMPNLTAVAPFSHYASRTSSMSPQRPAPRPASTGSNAPMQRNLHDANEAKAIRKTDIERRCQHMTPAIPPHILRHMDSFKAAIQISQPMNDYAWSVLEPRLLAQLPAAQQAEAEHVSRVASLPTRTADRRHPDVNSKETKETMDREWEESQRPVRDRLNVIATDFINHIWDLGNAVTNENCPKFAADLLAYVRRSFYAEGTREKANPNRQRTANVIDPHSKLILDNMKWVYDNKVKPLTEQFRKDIFLCSSTSCESNARYYGFEGIIQHFGAKHTSIFSVGNIVVAWREAEWPEETPFHSDPMSVKHAFHANSGATAYGGYYGGFSRAGTSTPHMQPHHPQASPGPFHFGGQYNGPFAPPQTSSSTIPGYDYPQPYATAVDTYAFQTMGPPGYGPHPAPGSYVPSPAMINPAVAPPPAMPVPIQIALETVTKDKEDPGHSTSSLDKQVSTVISMIQDIWKQTSGIKDLPNSLRIYVLLHRVISKFHIEFNHEPNLNHLIDALSNHEIPKAMKNAPGLSCKACQVASSHQPAGAYYSKSDERKTYTVLSLLSHFKTQHLPFMPMGLSYGQPVALLDWKEDMIELPSERFISGLIHAPGMDDEKLLLIATIFPSLFPTPLPKIGVVENHGMASPASSGSRNAKESSSTADVAVDPPKETGHSTLTSAQVASPMPSKSMGDEYDPLQPALTNQTNEGPVSGSKKQSHRDSPPQERIPRQYAESRYYMPREHLEEGYTQPREYIDYAPSPRITHSGPYGEYSGRRTVFREQERFYGPPAEELVYAHPREGSHGREYSSYPRQVRYYEEDDQRPEYRYIREPRSQEESARHGQAAADRFLEEFVPGQASAGEPERAESPPRIETKPTVLTHEVEDSAQYSPLPPNATIAGDAGTPIRPLAPPHPRAPSTVSNGSGFEDYRPNCSHVPMPPSGGVPRRVGPQRRRDRPYEQRMPARFYRYMGVPREDPYGRASSMSRSQSRRYEEQRRRIDQQETPQPNAEREYEPAYSRDPSVEHPSQEDGYYKPVRHIQRDYVSVQDRLHPYSHSPPRYRYDEPRGPHHVYVDDYGHPQYEYEIVRVRGEPRQQRPSYMQHQPPRYEHEPIQYVPVSYERPAVQGYNSRPGEYMYYEERERPLPKRPAAEAENEVYEPPPEIKVESAPVPMPEGA